MVFFFTGRNWPIKKCRWSQTLYCTSGSCWIWWRTSWWSSSSSAAASPSSLPGSTACQGTCPPAVLRIYECISSPWYLHGIWEIGEHVWSEIDNLICERHGVISTAVLNLKCILKSNVKIGQKIQIDWTELIRDEWHFILWQVIRFKIKYWKFLLQFCIKITLKKVNVFYQFKKVYIRFYKYMMG